MGISASGRKTNPFRVDVRVDRKQVNLGHFPTEEAALAALRKFNSDNYTAANITIHPELEFPFEKHARLCQQYKSFTPDGIRRLLEAALQVNEDWDVVERRFLQHHRDVDVSPEFRAVYAELADQRH